MDWETRKVLAWRLSNTTDTDFCVEALQEALGRYFAAKLFKQARPPQIELRAITFAVEQKNCRA